VAGSRSGWLLLGLLGVLALGALALLFVLRRDTGEPGAAGPVAAAGDPEPASGPPSAARPAGTSPRRTPTSAPATLPERSLPAEAARRRELDRIVHQGSQPGGGAPRVWPTKATDGGVRKLDQTAIRTAIGAVVPKVKRCYEDYLHATPGAPQSMRIKADFTIVAKNGEGHIDEGEAIPYAEGAREGVSLQDVTLRSCLLTALTTARFPMPPGDGRVRVKYPFLMRREEPTKR
jgi:hypothetical protein